jgi:UDP-GlcNAc:undecaprenyl-phosphate GlcNAc-1-phosphate transferase
MVGFLVALFVVSIADWDRTLPLVGGMAVLWVVGTIDDRHNVSPGLRVAFEAVVACGLWQAGLGWDLGLGGGVDLALTIVWVVGVVNAFNLFDNMDGAASTMALVVSACAAVLGLIHGDNWLAVAAATLCGACLGFLPHNLASPARIFLGDGGSMPIGLLVACTIMAIPDGQLDWTLLFATAPLAGLPILDTTLVVVSRLRGRAQVLSGGRDHITHRLLAIVGSERKVALVLAVAQAALCGLSIALFQLDQATVVLAAAAYLAAGAAVIAVLETAVVSPRPEESAS